MATISLEKIRIPITVVIAAISIAAGSGGTIAVASSKQARTEERVATNENRIKELEKSEQQNEVWKAEMKLLLEQTNKSVRRIERKMGIDE